MSALTKCLNLFFKGISLLIGICFLIGGGNCFLGLVTHSLFSSTTEIKNASDFVFMLFIILMPLGVGLLGFYIIKNIYNDSKQTIKPQDKTNES